MTREEIHARLEEIRADVHQQFDTDGLHEARLEQFDAAHATLDMLVGHLYEEDIRHRAKPKAHAKAIGAIPAEEE